MASGLEYNVSILAQMSSATDIDIANPDWYSNHSFGITISGTATVVVEWSTGGNIWHAAADAITSSDSVFISGVFPYLRVRVSSYSSGTIDVEHVAWRKGSD